MVLISPTQKLDVALVSDDTYSVLSETDTLGFVHKVGNVFVALSGGYFNHAIEIGQTLSFDQAVEIVRAHG